LISDTQADLLRNLKNLEPTVRALADVGPNLGTVLAYVPTFPYTQSFIDRAVRGDYLNLFLTFDLTVPRLKRTLFLGTRWGQEGAPLVPVPGDPWYSTYTNDPLHAPVTSRPDAVASIPPLVDPPAGNGDSAPPPAAAVGAPAAPDDTDVPPSPVDPAPLNGGG
jgi:phospholipid/cholesterol/gamma-HCH transport system substrate-binding protein